MLNLKQMLNKLMGIRFDMREPSGVFAPASAKCPVTDCTDRGRYTNCYLRETMCDCEVYARYAEDSNLEGLGVEDE